MSRRLTLVIRFTTPCLGATKITGGLFRLPRDPAGAIVFPSHWLQDALRKVGLPHAGVVHCHPVLALGAARPLLYRRSQQSRTGKQRFAAHEAFLVGMSVGLTLELPVDYDLEVLRVALKTVGETIGLSPYRRDEYGRFEVVELS